MDRHFRTEKDRLYLDSGRSSILKDVYIKMRNVYNSMKELADSAKATIDDYISGEKKPEIDTYVGEKVSDADAAAALAVAAKEQTELDRIATGEDREATEAARDEVNEVIDPMNEAILDLQETKLDDVQEGANITIDKSDPKSPVISSVTSEYNVDAAQLSFLVSDWALSESFAYSNLTYDAAGNVDSGTITWPDGDIGSISNVVVGTHGITSIRYNRSDGKYATVSIVYAASGDFSSQSITLTGF